MDKRGIVRELELMILEGIFEGVCEEFFIFLGKLETGDAGGGEFFDSGFGELEAEAGLVDRGVLEVREGEEGMEEFSLFIEGGIFEGIDMMGEEGVINFLDKEEDGEVVRAGEVDAEEEWGGGVMLGRE